MNHEIRWNQKQAYREHLVIDEAEVKLVYLKGDYDLIRERLAQRQGHFMPPGLLASQFATLGGCPKKNQQALWAGGCLA
jgi:gluconate kinase